MYVGLCDVLASEVGDMSGVYGQETVDNVEGDCECESCAH